MQPYSDTKQAGVHKDALGGGFKASEKNVDIKLSRVA